jgi:hypothetical protein
MLVLLYSTFENAQHRAYSEGKADFSTTRVTHRDDTWESACATRKYTDVMESIWSQRSIMTVRCSPSIFTVIGSQLFACKRFSEWLEELLS